MQNRYNRIALQITNLRRVFWQCETHTLIQELFDEEMALHMSRVLVLEKLLRDS